MKAHEIYSCAFFVLRVLRLLPALPIILYNYLYAKHILVRLFNCQPILIVAISVASIFNISNASFLLINGPSLIPIQSG